MTTPLLILAMFLTAAVIRLALAMEHIRFLKMELAGARDQRQDAADRAHQAEASLEDIRAEQARLQQIPLEGPFAVHLPGGLYVNGPLDSIEDVQREAEALALHCHETEVLVLAPVGTVKVMPLWSGEPRLVEQVQALGARS